MKNWLDVNIAQTNMNKQPKKMKKKEMNNKKMHFIITF